jgi:hypothetical protein
MNQGRRRAQKACRARNAAPDAPYLCSTSCAARQETAARRTACRQSTSLTLTTSLSHFPNSHDFPNSREIIFNSAATPLSLKQYTNPDSSKKVGAPKGKAAEDTRREAAARSGSQRALAQQSRKKSGKSASKEEPPRDAGEVDLTLSPGVAHAAPATAPVPKSALKASTSTRQVMTSEQSPAQLSARGRC